MRRAPSFVALASVLAVSACAVPPPSGPTVMALPPQGKPFDAFQQDDAVCRGFASQQTGGASASQAASNAAVGSAVIGTALGAGLGAAIGAAAGSPGAGAAIGGATGLLAGSAAGANNAQAAGGNEQARYDTAYTQCMYSRGNSVQSAPTSYAYGYPPGYAYGPAYGYAPGIYASPTVVIGGGWGWGHGYYGHGWDHGYYGHGWGGGWHH